MYRIAILSLAALLPSLPVRGAPVDPSSAPQGVNGNGNPFSFPLTNGFPDMKYPSKSLTDLEDAALGTPPQEPPPPTLSKDDLTSIRLIAFNEIFEVAFFTELLFNVTNNVTGYEIEDADTRQKVIDALTTVQAQEEVHAITPNEVLKHLNATPIEPCQYVSPATNLTTAFNLARTFTDVVLGTLANIQTHFAQNDGDGFIPVIGAMIANEGEQNGFYRHQIDLVPSALPFLTASSRAFAFSALNQMFVVKGSCPNSDTIDLPIFRPLNVEPASVRPEDQNLTFTIAGDAPDSSEGLSLVYINQQNSPIVVNITGAKFVDRALSFSAQFPYEENLMNGLTIAAVTKSAGPFDGADAVANATVAGPGLIEVN